MCVISGGALVCPGAGVRMNDRRVGWCASHLSLQRHDDHAVGHLLHLRQPRVDGEEDERRAGHDAPDDPAPGRPCSGHRYWRLLRRQRARNIAVA